MTRYRECVQAAIQNKDKRGKIKNNDYIVAFDVEVFPSSNNYRTHKVIHEMDLTPVHHTDTGTDQPQGSGEQDPSASDITRYEQFVNEKKEHVYSADEEYLAFIRHLEAAELWQKVEELKREYRRNMERLEEAEREAELDAAFWKYWD